MQATSEIYQTEDCNGNIVDNDVVIRFTSDSYYNVNGDTFDVATSVPDDRNTALLEVVALENYPNLFNAQTIISYNLSELSQVTLDIFDVLGHKISTLVNERQQAGYYQVIWDANEMPSGVYFYKIMAGEFLEAEKMLLIK